MPQKPQVQTKIYHHVPSLVPANSYQNIEHFKACFQLKNLSSSICKIKMYLRHSHLHHLHTCPHSNYRKQIHVRVLDCSPVTVHLTDFIKCFYIIWYIPCLYNHKWPEMLKALTIYIIHIRTQIKVMWLIQFNQINSSYHPSSQESLKLILVSWYFSTILYRNNIFIKITLKVSMKKPPNFWKTTKVRNSYVGNSLKVNSLSLDTD